MFAESAQDVVGVLESRREALRDLVANTGRTFEQLTADEQALTTFVLRNTELFDELAERREALADSIRILPTFLAETKTTLSRVRTFAVNTEPLIRDLDPVLDDLQPTLASLRRLSPDLENLFENIDPLISAGDDGLPALSRILRGLDPTLTSTGPFLQQLNPLLRYLEFNQTKVSDFFGIPGSTLGGIRSAPAGSKSNGHVLPQIIMVGAESLPALSRTKTNRGNAYIRPDAAPRPGEAHPAELRLQQLRREGPDEHAGLPRAGPGAVRGPEPALPAGPARPARRPAEVAAAAERRPCRHDRPRRGRRPRRVGAVRGRRARAGGRRDRPCARDVRRAGGRRRGGGGAARQARRLGRVPDGAGRRRRRGRGGARAA